FAEVIIGSTVLMFDNDDDGNLELTQVLSGDATAGSNGSFGLFSCVADLSSEPGQELVAGTSLYRLPDTLPTCATPPCSGALTKVWDAETVAANVDGNKTPTKPNGSCAVANLWGDDFSSPPGPDNDPRGCDRAEVVLISDGYLTILDGATGELIEERNLEGGDRGGAPNIDDFDGDGFMEVASALQDFYVVVDLQPPTNNADFSSLGACPAWPATLERSVGDNSDPSSFNPNLKTSGNEGDIAKPRSSGGACTQASDCAAGMTCSAVGECICLHNGWQRGSDDASSKSTSSSVFDFNGDGVAEVIYNDECEMRVYDGVNGAVYYNENSRSRTGIENPIVADVDNDGNAEIVTVLNTDSNNRCDDDPGGIATGPNGIRVWGDPSDTWVSARRIWNQMSYSVTNINESGSVPQHAAESWKSFNGRVYNTYRSQPRNSGVAPDLTISGVSITSPDAACGTLSELLDIGFQAENQGDLRVGPGVVVSFYGTWDGSEEPLLRANGEPLLFTLSKSLEPKAVLIASVAFDLRNQGNQTTLPNSIRVEIDSENEVMTGYGAERECDESNNSTSATVEAGETQPDLVVSTETSDYNCSSGLAEVGLRLENVGSRGAEGFDVDFYAGDPAQGGSFLHRESFSESLAPGATITPIVEFSAIRAENAIIWAIVNPEQSLSECNYANNLGPADAATRSCAVVVR
ncbi:MAG: VCBS repeat-containing protein, partial [Polyangiaceae bacterium]|nr:VCBS repeat-containing protein [Polyangiaceae bacterium]